MTPETPIAEDVVAEAVAPASASEPHTTCAQCARAFDWRDEVYAHAATTGLCKRCQQRGAHARLGVVAFHPATTQGTQGHRATRRGHGGHGGVPTAPLFDPMIAPKSRKPTRAERRAKARKEATEQGVAVPAA